MNVVFLNPISNLGGAERVLLDVMTSIRQSYTSINMSLIVGEDGPLVAEVRAIGVGVQVHPMPRHLASLGERAGSAAAMMSALPAAIQYARSLGAQLDRLRPDIVHSNGLKMHLLSRLSGTGGGKLLWHVHDFVGERRLTSKLLRVASGRVSCAVAVSHAVASDLASAVPRMAVRTILNAVDTEHFSPGDSDPVWLDRAAGLEPLAGACLHVGLVATYARWKGHELFLQAASALLRTSSIPLRFYLIGGPIYSTAGSQWNRAELVSLAAKLGLISQVGFVSFMDNPVQAYRALDIVVHASTRPEPFGRTIIEAMACGTASVVANAGGAAEIVTDRHDAFLYRMGDVNDLVQAVQALINDDQLRVRIANQARRSAIAKFDRRRVGPDWIGLYEEIVAKVPLDRTLR